ncbi:MAG: CAP domain-containing protein [Sporomusaceae bacterium]|nr:CAP domain-containing protein [Sporomusaceae bacterium]
MITACKKKFISGLMAFSLLSTSFGGAFAASVYADSAETVAESEQETVSGKNILVGLAAIGLIAALANSSDDDKAPAASSGSGSSNTGGSSSSGTTVLTAQEQEAFTLLNNDRAKNGLSALKVNSQLTKVAESHAKDMIARGYFAHNTPEGTTPFDRMKQAGISYRTAGENLAINSSVAAAETAFMNSSGHRANILNSDYTDVGIGVVQNSKGQLYVVQEFIGQ